jgi:predicted nucleic acid-binding protein
MCVLHPFDEVVLARALDLVMNSVLGGRDAVHAATALSLGFDHIVSADRDFDAAPGLRRIAPGDVPTA